MRDHEIRAQIRAGAMDVDDLGERCTAGTSCGNCKPVIESILAESGVSIRTLAAV